MSDEGMHDDDLEETYRRYYPVIWAKCRRMLRDSAEAQDLAQETFARLWASRKSLRDPDAALGWVYRTATRLAVDKLRHQQVVARHLALHADEGGGDLARLEAREGLTRLARRLPMQQLEVLLLCRVDGLTHRETADVLETSERSVRRLLQRAERGLARSDGDAR